MYLLLWNILKDICDSIQKFKLCSMYSQHKSDISNVNINEGKQNDLVRFLYRWSCNANDVNKTKHRMRLCRILQCVEIYCIQILHLKK